MSDYETGLSAAMAETVVTAARTSIGDTLRSVVYFTPAAFDLLYVREDLYDTDQEARRAKRRLVEFETVDFGEQTLQDGESETALGPYELTVRIHERGFVARVFGGGGGVLLTTDDLDVPAFEEAASAVIALLEGEHPEVDGGHPGDG